VGCWWEAGCEAINSTVEFVEDDVIPVAREGVEVAGELATGAGENIQQTMALIEGGEDQMVAVRNDQTMGREADRRIATREATTEMIEQAAEVFAAERNKIITAAEDYLDCIERLDHFMQQLTDELIEMNVMPEALRTNRKYYGSVEHYRAGNYSQKLQKMMSWKNQSAEVGSDGMTMGTPSSWGDQVGTSPLENTYSKEWLNSSAFKEQNYGCIGSVEDQTNEWWGDHRFKQWCWFANGTNFPLTVNNLYPDFKLDQFFVDMDMGDTGTAMLVGYPHGWLTNLAMLYFTVGTLTYNDPWSEGGETLEAEGPGRDPHQVEPGNPSGKFPWGSFTRRQVVAFKTGGADTMMGFSNIMQHNHGDTHGMAPQSFFDYSEQSSMREVGNSAEHCDVDDLTVEPGYTVYLHGETESGLGVDYAENAEVMQFDNKQTWAYSTMYGVLWANNIYGQQPQGSAKYGRGGLGAIPDFIQTNYVWTPSACAKRMRSMGETFKSMSGEYALPGMSALGELMVNAGNAINTLVTEADDYVWDLKECHERIQAGLCQVARDSPGFPEDWADNFSRLIRMLWRLSVI